MRASPNDPKLKADYLGLLLEDEVFSQKEEYILDECMGFLLGMTSAPTAHIVNFMYFLIQYPHILKMIREEQ